MIKFSKAALTVLCTMLVAVGMGQPKVKPVPDWLRTAVFYQIYPQSFKDTDGDGIGDINGIIEKLDYLKWLGCNAIWINPCFESAFQDAGYDVIDFYKVAARYGTNADMVRLFKEAHKRNMKVCLDLVAGHTSVESPWFKMSQKKTANEYTDRYIWTSDSTVHPDRFVTGKFERNGAYMKNFFDCQPALNYGYGQPDPKNSWEQPIDAPGPVATRKELMRIMDFWMDKGCDGFRVDLASSLVKNDPDLKGTYRIWSEIRSHFQGRYPKGALIAEWGNPTRSVKAGFMVDFLIQFGGSGYNELFFNKQGVFRRDTCYFDLAGNGSPEKFIASLHRHLDSVSVNGYVCIPTSNHDFQRPNSGARNTVPQLKCVMAFMLTMPGIPLVYYGDEIGMRYIPDLPNKEGSVVRRGNRAGSRTPMQWDTTANAGFSAAAADKLYLPIDPNTDRPTVSSQRNDTSSLLSLTRKLLAVRAKYPALASRGEITFLNTPDKAYPLVYLRAAGRQKVMVVINPSGREQSFAAEGWNAKHFKLLAGGKVDVNSHSGTLALRAKATSFAIFLVD